MASSVLPPWLSSSTQPHSFPSLATNTTAVMTDSVLANVTSMLQTTNGSHFISTGPSLVSSTTTPVSNITEEERRRFLEQLMQDTTIKMIPTIVFLSMVAVVGVCGNSLVLLVYSRKPRQNATDIYFMAIAVFDLMTNVLTVPGEINKLVHYWDYDNIASCGFLGFCNAYTTVTSVMVILAVAVCRYKKICRQYKRQTSVRTARVVCAVIALVCCLIATPAVVLSGLLTLKTPRDGIHGKQCSLDDKYFNTIWPMIHSIFQMLLFFSMFAAIFVLYSFISRQAWRQHKLHASLMSAKRPIATAVESEKKESRVANVGLPGEKSTSDSAQDVSRKVDNSRQIHTTYNTYEKPPSEVEVDNSTTTTDDACEIISVPKGDSNINDKSNFADNEIGTPEDQGTDNIRKEVVSHMDNGKKDKSSEEGREQNTSVHNGQSSPEKGRLSRNHSQERGLHRKLTDTLTRARKTAVQPSIESDDSDNDSSSYTVEMVKSAGKAHIQNEKKGIKSKRGELSGRKSRRPRGKVLTKATVISIAITATLLVAFLPYLIITLCVFTQPNFFDDMTPAGFVFYQLFLRFFVVNSAANAIIYGICDVRFREQCWKILRRE